MGAGQARVRRRADGRRELVGELRLRCGEQHDLVVVIDCEGDPPIPDAQRAWQATESW